MRRSAADSQPARFVIDLQLLCNAAPKIFDRLVGAPHQRVSDFTPLGTRQVDSQGSGTPSGSNGGSGQPLKLTGSVARLGVTVRLATRVGTQDASALPDGGQKHEI